MREPIAYWDFGLAPCHALLKSMEAYLETPMKPPALWLGEHHTVATLGPRSCLSDVHNPLLPTLFVPRGGQVTLHMPGQLMIYPLICLKDFGLTIRQWITLLEEVIIQVLKSYSLEPLRCHGEPGVFLTSGKIASVGIKIKKGWSYLGLCLNVSCNLQVFESIIPCGLPNRAVTSLYQHGEKTKKILTMSSLKKEISMVFSEHLSPQIS